MNNRVYELRKKRGWSLTQLAQKSGVCKSAINNFENGKTKPTAETVNSLANALGVSRDELFEEKKPKRVAVKKSVCPEKTKEEYIDELQAVFSKIETYKVRWFYIFTMAKLGLLNNEKEGVCHE